MPVFVSFTFHLLFQLYIILLPFLFHAAHVTLRGRAPARAASALTLGKGAEPLIEVSAQNLLHEGCRHSGWLRKRGIYVKSWKHRYHILKNGCFYYFRDENCKSAKGQFSLNNYRVQLCTGVASLPWSFQLVNSDITKRTWYFVASSEQERRTWMEMIEKDIAAFCAPGTVPRPSVVSDIFSDDEGDGQTDEQVANEMYDKPFDDSSPFDKTGDLAPPPITSRDKSLKPSNAPGMVLRAEPLLPPRGSMFPPSQPPKQQALPPPRVTNNNSSSLRGNNRTPMSLPGRPRSVTDGRMSSDDSSDDGYLHLVEEERQRAMQQHPPTDNGLSSNKADSLARPKKRILAGSVKLPSMAMQDTPRKPAPYQPKANEPQNTNMPQQPRSPHDPRRKPVPTPRSKQTTVEPPRLPDHEFDDFGGNQCAAMDDTQDVLPKSAFRNVDREGADRLLRAKGVDGLYLLREGSNAGSDKVLTVWTHDRCRHYKVFYQVTSGYCLTKGVSFPSMVDLVEHYRRFLLPKSDNKLSRPLVD